MKNMNVAHHAGRSEQNVSASRRIEIDFLFLDLTTCTRCVGTDKNLETALGTVQQVLEATGIEVRLNRILVKSADQARTLRFVSSPTIRVNGRDIALEFRESRCEDCESCASGESVNCRVWVYQGKEYTKTPVGMIVEAILQAVYSDPSRRTAAPTPYDDLPENLKRFFSGKAKTGGTIKNGDCCPPSEQAVCCEPAEKETCCPPTAGGASCGCR